MSSRCQSISVWLKAEALNLLTSTSFFFLVMFFWSFSGWGAALLTGGLEQRVARGTSVDQRRPEPGSSLPAPPPGDPPPGLIQSSPPPPTPEKLLTLRVLHDGASVRRH